jgi:hypothetical protein
MYTHGLYKIQTGSWPSLSPYGKKVSSQTLQANQLLLTGVITTHGALHDPNLMDRGEIE